MTVIRKYGNRRLYDTVRSRYINLDELAALIRSGEPVRVEDATTHADLTHEVLLQIVVEVLHGGEMLPAGFLRRIIRATGDDPAQRLLRQQLSTGLDVLSRQMDQVEALFGAVPIPKPAPATPTAAPEAPPAAEPAPDDEVAALRERLTRLEARLKRP